MYDGTPERAYKTWESRSRAVVRLGNEFAKRIQAEYERIHQKDIDIQEPRSLPFGGIISTLKDPDGNGVILMMWQSEASA